MTIWRSVFGGCLMSLAVTAATSAQEQAAASPTVEQLQQAIDAVKKDAPKIETMLGCLPAHGEPETQRVCVLQFNGLKSNQEIAFRRDGGGWQLVLDEAGEPVPGEAACAPLEVAEAALRRIRGDAGLRVTGSVDEGAGIFTDARGMLRDKPGPYRLMCRYDVSTVSGAEYLYLTYVWHDGSQYVIDPDVEVWTD